MLICLTSLTQEEDKIILNKETGIELTEIPLTTQRKASKHLLSDEDLYDGHEEDGIFTTQQLFFLCLANSKRDGKVKILSYRAVKLG